MPPIMSIRGGKKIQPTMLTARMNTATGVCSRTAPSVPPITISAAGPLSNAETCPPSRKLPPTMATNARVSPIRLSTSI